MLVVYEYFDERFWVVADGAGGGCEVGVDVGVGEGGVGRGELGV